MATEVLQRCNGYVPKYNSCFYELQRASSLQHDLVDYIAEKLACAHAIESPDYFEVNPTEALQMVAKVYTSEAERQ
jgi:hypothetical protein